MSSAAITCSRKVGEKFCGRRIIPVFGVYPEICTNCALGVIVNSKEGQQAFEKVLDDHYHRVRALVVAGAVPRNDWRVDGLELHQRFQMLEAFEKQIAARRLMRAMNIAQRMADNSTNEARRASLGYMWGSVDADRAIALKKAGFEVRYIGVEWQVKIS
jgi:hypothetical protein